jgi:cyclic pyranopterin phosphate synthase
MDDVVPAAEIVRTIGSEWPLASADPNYTGEVASRYRYLDGAGEIGVISSVTQAFCRTCTRARLSAEGRLFTCLFGIRGHDFRVLLRGGESDEQISEFLRSVWARRTDRYSEIRSAQTIDLPKIEMSYIGG